MSKLKKIRVRPANSNNIGLFRKLWRGVLESHAKDGSVIVPSDQSLEAYEQLFNAYTEGSLKGVVLFVAASGVLMWGETGSLLQYTSKTITAWGSYAESDLSEEINKALFDEALKWAKDNGFKSILFETYNGSPKQEEFEQIAVVSCCLIED